MKKIADKICGWLDGKQPVAVVTILGREGSAPRTAGTKMVVGPGGVFTGTIGGGKIEADVLEASGEALSEQRPKRMRFRLTGEDVSGMDMICGGTLDILIDVVIPDSREAERFNSWNQAWKKGKPALLATVIKKNPAKMLMTEHCLVFAEGRILGESSHVKTVRNQLADLARTGGPSKLIESDGVEILAEPISPRKTLIIFGAGHVSVPTARIAAMVGFRVVVADDRSEYANRERFPDADDVIVVEGFGTAMSHFNVDPFTGIVIVTRGHRHDKIVLAKALNTPAGYIGMIGSRRKRDTIYNALRMEGFSNEDLQRVHSPIGLDIGAETPEEIAVSIVSELIAYRAGKIP